MATDANPPRRTGEQRTEDDDRVAAISQALADTVEAVVPGWIERLALDRMRASGGQIDPAFSAAAAAAGEAARDDVVPRLRALLAADIDEQRTNPLALLRSATVHAHAVLAAAGVPPADRDEFAQRSFPDDSYGLVPASWEEIDQRLQEVGITWGAAKAYVFKARRREEGRR
jgi:hypothetical protein